MPRLTARSIVVVFPVAALFILTSVLGAGPVAGAGSVEGRFLEIPSAEGALETARFANAQSHYAGTRGDYAFARYMRDRLVAAGFQATIESYQGPIDKPARLGLALIDDAGNVTRRFDLREGPVPGDPDGTRADVGLPFNYGSGSGDVRAPLIAVGRGLSKDYVALAAHHTSVRGRIALIAYGAQFRGLLAARAQRNGAAGIIFYSDPREDRGRPETSVQRGTVGADVMRIPTLPVTYRTARVLLAQAARGGRAELSVTITRRTGTMWNTVGILNGVRGEPVVLGGHRDAWVYGVTDNGSGIATLLEVARAFGGLARAGWKPQRTIVIVGFDAEEIGELGSRAFVEAHRDDIVDKAVAYLNCDEDVTGPHFGDDSAAAIGAIVTSAARDLGIAGVPRVPPIPGGGSDHESFLFAPGPGVPTAQIGFGGHLPTYHSAYDDLYFALQIDPGFALHRRAAQVLGLIALRLSETAHPYRFTPYVDQMRDAQAALLTDPAVITLATDPAVLGDLDAAIAHFSAAATDIDSAPAKHPLKAEISATHLIDRALYGSTGYRDVAFPGIHAALASGNAGALTRATRAATRAINRAADLISPETS
jgi:N-acetylated-alpha-linked acidic dipeptidase